MEKKRILHFDINGTIIGTDSTDSHSIESAVCESLCRSIRFNNDTYYNHLKSNYYDYKKRVNNVLSCYPEYIETVKKLCVIYQGYFFPSFIKVIQSLKPTDKVMLRTFGQDGSDVISKLDKLYTMKFETFHCRYSNDKPEFYYEGEGLPVTLKQIYQNVKDHVLIIDDYGNWDRNNRKAESGKFIEHIDDVEQIAFDDNNCMFTDITNNTDNTDDSNNIKIYKIVTVDAALDDQYYLNLINQV
jgi:hypothetical protein